MPFQQHQSSTRILYTLTNWALFGAGLVNLVAGTLSAFRGQVGIAATSLTAGLALLFAATIDRFESLKGLGVEAKTRKLDQKIEQADEALTRLKEITELTSSALIDLNCKIGRWDSAPTPRALYALARQTHSLLTAQGTEPQRIREILDPWALIMCRDLAFALTNPLRKAAIEESRRVQNEFARIPQPINVQDPTFLRVNSERESIGLYRQRLDSLPALTLADYPDVLIGYFDDVPLIDAKIVATAKTAAERFAAGMRSIRERLLLDDPESWFSEIDSSRKS